MKNNNKQYLWVHSGEKIRNFLPKFSGAGEIRAVVDTIIYQKKKQYISIYQC